MLFAEFDRMMGGNSGLQASSSSNEEDVDFEENNSISPVRSSDEDMEMGNNFSCVVIKIFLHCETRK